VLALLRLAYALDIPAAWLLVGLDARDTLPPPGGGHPLPARGAQDATRTYGATPAPQPGDPGTLLRLLGATLRQSRQQHGLTHKALAAKTGLDKSYIGEIERGERNVSVLNVVRLADALGLSVSHVLAPLDIRQNPPPPLPE